MKQSRIKTILFAIIAVVSITLLVYAVQKTTIFSPNASGAVPQLVTISNITDTSAAVAWSTGTQATITHLQWGDTTTLSKTAGDFRDTRDNVTKARKTHYVELTGLQPSTTYHYRIVAGDTTYPTADQPAATFKTLPKVSEVQPTSVALYGDIETQDTDVLVTVYVPGELGYSGVIPQTTVLHTDGTWAINLASARKSTGEFLSVTTSTPIALIGIGPDSKGVAKSTKASETPITLELGAQLSQGMIDGVLLSAVTVTPSITATPTVTSSRRQDVPLNPVGTTTTPTPTTTVSTGDTEITREQLLASFSTPSVSNVTDSSISMLYVTSSAVISTLNWGTSAGSLTSNRLDDRDQLQATSRHIHHYTLPSLSSNTQYFMKPTSESTTRTFTTPAKIATPSGSTVITGTMTNGEGECLVRTQIKRNSVFSSIITTLPNASNAWSVNIKPVRTTMLDAYLTPIATDTVLTNAFCIKSNGDVLYYSGTTTVQNAVTSGISVTLTTLQ
ncbi:fibronectin type III domain-containing protein [bacterium]|nr:fibronectin type III domain-containing protein [bacterium]